MPSTIQQKIEALRQEIHQHNYNYYVLDEATISDILTKFQLIVL